MKSLRNKFLSAVTGVVLAVMSLAANASPIQFIYTGTGSGSLGGSTFSSAAFTFTQFGDTSTKQSCGIGCTFIDAVSASVSIAGLGSYAFVTGTRTFDYQGLVGFSRAGAGGADLYNVFNVGPTYDMASSVGPISGSANLLQWSLSPIVTAGGTLVFNNASTLGTFQAVTAVPEPETYALMLAGLGLMGAVARRSKVSRG